MISSGRIIRKFQPVEETNGVGDAELGLDCSGEGGKKLRTKSLEEEKERRKEGERDPEF